MVNRVILIGNLGKDPEIRRFENGAVVAKFTLATNENYKDKGGEWQTMTEWHEIVAWRTLGERAESSLKKGMLVYVEGKLTHRTWQDQDGNNRKTTEIVASYFRTIGKREASSSSDFQSQDDTYYSGSNSSLNHSNEEMPVSEDMGQPSIDDDLPF